MGCAASKEVEVTKTVIAAPAIVDQPATSKPSVAPTAAKEPPSTTVAPIAATHGVQALIDRFQAGYWDGTAVECCTADALFNPPGLPPTPIADVLRMLGPAKAAFPEWKSLCHGVSQNADGTYRVLTQQCPGPMKGDMPAMGTFPAVTRASAPDVVTKDLKFPVEVGTYTLAPGGKIACGKYTGAAEALPSAPVTEEISAIWNKNGDLSDVGLGALFQLMSTLRSTAQPEPMTPGKEAAAQGASVAAAAVAAALGEVSSPTKPATPASTTADGTQLTPAADEPAADEPVTVGMLARVRSWLGARFQSSADLEHEGAVAELREKAELAFMKIDANG